MNIKTTLLLTFLLLAVTIYGQDIRDWGAPYIHNFTPDDYGELGKIWDITSDNTGILYLASDRGLIRYDGSDWEPLQYSAGSCRSILLSHDSLLYTGSDMDFGRWDLNTQGVWTYQSLYPYKNSPKGLNEEFWGVHKINDEIVFVSFDNLYVHKNDQLTKISAPERIVNSFVNDNILYIVDEAQGLYTFDGLSLKRLFTFPHEGLHIIGAISVDSALLLTTRSHGLYQYSQNKLTPINNPLSQNLKKYHAFSFTPIDSTLFAWGTIRQGLYIGDAKGNIKYHLNVSTGLANNTVLNLYSPNQDIIYAALNRGFAVIDLHDDTRYFIDFEGALGSPETALLHHETLFIGSNQGLFTIPWKGLSKSDYSRYFKFVQGSMGQVWDLATWGDIILCGHDAGLFIIQSNSIQKVTDISGVMSITHYKDNYWLAGTYNGVYLLENKNEKWLLRKRLEHISGACQQVTVLQDKRIAVKIPNYGILQTTLSPTLQATKPVIHQIDSLVNDASTMTHADNRLYLTTQKNTYQIPPNAQEGPTLLTNQSNLNAIKHTVNGSHALALNDNIFFYPTDNGFAISANDTLIRKDTFLPILLHSVKGFSGGKMSENYLDKDIPSHYDTLVLRIATPGHYNTAFQYKLNNQDQWSAWSPGNSIRVSALSSGSQTIHIRGKSGDKIYKPQAFTITISNPWTEQLMTIGKYLILGLLFGSVYFYFQRKLRHQQHTYEDAQRQVEDKQNELKQKLDKLVNENAALTQKLKHKSIKLIVKDRELEDATRLLDNIKIKLGQENKSNHKLSQHDRKEIMRLVSIKNKTKVNTLELQLDELNQAFLNKLNEKHPELTTYDLRLCTFIKYGLNSHEIAQILNVLPSSINVSRSRLRKKLGLSTHQNLFNFLQQFQAN